jgi:hypothetical protein
MASKLLNLLALSSLAILVCSFGATPVAALSTSGQHLARRMPAHNAISKKKRGNVRRCRSRNSSSNSNTSSYNSGPSSDSPPANDTGSSDSTPPISSPDIQSDSNYDPTDGGSDPSSSSPSDSSGGSPPNGNTHHGSNTPSTSNSYGGDNSTASDSPNSPSNSSSSVTPPPSSAGSPTGTGKVGLAWANGNDPSLQNFKTDRVTWLYTWSPDCPSQSAALGFICIPMLWGPSQVSDFQNLVVQGYANTVFGFNEPNEGGQSNLQPDEAAQLWQQYIDPLKNQGYKLISPATSSNPNGIVWMNSFFSSCGGCQFDGVAVHWYDVGSQSFIDYINLWYTTYNKDIWVTEFACQNFNGGAQCTGDEITAFMTTVTQYMDGQSWVVGYAAFGVMVDMQGVNQLDSLMNSDGTPTALGELYVSA